MSTKYGRRAAFTLIEVLTSISILVVLLALTISAVQAAREASRRAACAANLHQIGIALQNHAESSSKLPAGSGSKVGESYLVQILPYIDQQTLYNSINLDSHVFFDFGDANITAFVTKVPSFFCPSDARRTDFFAITAANYPGNIGVREEGSFPARKLGLAEITDGLSGTVAVSEWIVGPGTAQEGPRLGAIFSLSKKIDLNTLEDFTNSCISPKPDQAMVSIGFKGRWWLNGSAGQTLYNHTLTPNNPSCLYYGSTSLYVGITAGSFHPGGAHALMLDGSTRFIKDSVNKTIWSAMGTRGGNEIVEQQ